MSIDAGADALGFVFAPSPRRVTPEQAAAIISVLPPAIEKIGVFVNESPAHVAELGEQAKLTGVQLHGDEPPEQLAEFRAALGTRKIIKALHAREMLVKPRRLDDYLDVSASMDAILLDSGSPQNPGGTGMPFDWEAAQSIAARIREHLPLIVAGGLRPENVAEAIRIFHCSGLDVVSGVEREAGKKDATKVRAFMAAARVHEQVKCP